MKKIQFLLTLLAFAAAGAGVFANAMVEPSIDPQIDLNGDTICDTTVLTNCVVPSGDPCTYDDEGTSYQVFDRTSGCAPLGKQRP